MKKKLFSICAMATMLFMASCSEEELISNSDNGDEGVVRFSIGLEDGITTRALAKQENISDGKGADQLMYAVFNAKGDALLVEKDTKDGVNFDPAYTLDLKLAKNQTYNVVFWAQNSECKAYTVSNDMNVSVNYTGVLNNDETRDAFFKAYNFTVTGNSQTEEVVLKRPFAQLNVGVTKEDWENAVKSGIKITNSTVKVDDVATRLNLLTGEVSEEETVEFALNTIPADLTLSADDETEKELIVKNEEGKDVAYKWLSMTYLLVNDGTSTGAEKAILNDVAFTFKPEAGNNIDLKDGLKGVVPVQRNWRTNIIGQILTGNVTFKITIDQDYDGEYNGLPFDQVGKGVKISETGIYYTTIEEAIEAVDDNGSATIELAAGNYGATTTKATEDGFLLNINGSKTITIKAADGVAAENVVFDGQIRVGGSANITIKGITLTNENAYTAGTSQMAKHCVCLTHKGSVTVEDCIFNLKKASSSGILDWWTTDENCTVTVKNSTFNCNGERPLQIHVNAGIQNCTFNEPYRYVLQINNNEASTIVMKNNKLVKNQTTNDKPAYFIQLTNGGSEETDFTQNKTFELENNTFEGTSLFIPYVYESGTVKAETMTVVGSTFDKTFMEIDNKNKTVIADGLVKLVDAEENTYEVSNANGLAALNQMFQNKTAGRNTVINLTSDIDFTGKTWVPVDSHADTSTSLKEINGNGHTLSNLTINGQAMFTRFAGHSSEVIIKDLTFDNAKVTSTQLNTSILTVQSYQNVTLDNVDVKNSSITGAYKVAPLIASVYDEKESETVTATLKNCDVSNTIVKGSLDFMICGMVAWVAKSNKEEISFENCTVDNVTLQVPSNGSYGAYGYIYSINGVAEDTYNEATGVTVTNCKVETY